MYSVRSPADEHDACALQTAHGRRCLWRIRDGLRGFVAGEGAALAFDQRRFLKFRHSSVPARIEREIARNVGDFLPQVLD